MPITDPIFLTTFQGDTITRDGVTYVWVNGKYQVSTSLTSEQQIALNISKKVVLKFSGILKPDNVLTGQELRIYIDGQEWLGNYRIENANSVQIILDEPFIRTQRLITFKTEKGNPLYRYAVKSQVYSSTDVVVAKFGITEDIPVLGTNQTATINYTTPTTTNTTTIPTITTPTGTTGTGNTINTQTSGVSVNYESSTVQIGVDGFNTNDQLVDATIGEVAGPIYL